MKLYLVLSALVLGLSGGAAKADLYTDALSRSGSGKSDQARSRFVVLAAQGDSRAQFQLGLMYHRGRGVPQNYRNAAQWYRLAAGKNNADARNNLGILYRDGLGVGQSSVLAYMWFSLAASQEIGGALGRKNRNALANKMSRDEILQAQQLAEEYAVGLEKHKKRQLALIDAAKEAPARAPVNQAEIDPKMVTALPASESQPDPETEEAEPGSSERPNAAERWLRKQIRAALAFLNPASEKERRYLVQLGLFRDSTNVDRVQGRLRALGIEVNVEAVTVSGAQYHRLRVGPYASEQEARAMAGRFDRIFKINALLVPTTF